MRPVPIRRNVEVSGTCGGGGWVAISKLSIVAPANDPFWMLRFVIGASVVTPKNTAALVDDVNVKLCGLPLELKATV